MRTNNNTGRKSTLKLLALTSTALVGLAVAPAAQAQDWTGASSPGWGEAANWNPAHVPTAADDVTITSVPPGNNQSIRVVNGYNAVAHDITVDLPANGNGAPLLVAQGGTLTANQITLGATGGRRGDLEVGNLGGAAASVTTAGSLIVGDRGIGNLYIGNGTVNSGSGVLGANVGGSGLADVNGADAVWTNSGFLTVGGGGNGALNILGGGTVSNADTGVVGSGVGSIGNVTVYGPGSTWTNSADVVIGANGAGTLKIEKGGTVTFVDFLVGQFTKGSGVVVVDGVGSNLTGGGDLVVGVNGQGAVTMSNGATVGSANGIIGKSGLFTNTVTVDGAIWTNGLGLTVGEAGNGALSILNGGVVSNADTGVVGSAVGSTGNVTVSGTGSTWTNSADVVIGANGAGTLKIEQGGTVTFGDFLVGQFTKGSGVVVVDGVGSNLTGGGDLVVGINGLGKFVVSNGGNASNANGVIGASGQSSSSAIIDGSGSTWTNTGSLYVGDSGSGTLNISNGGQVTAGFTSVGSSIGADGTMTVDGPNSSFVGSDNLTIGSFGSGVMGISNGGTVSNLQGTIGAVAGSTGNVTVAGVGSNWTSNFLFVGDNGSGTLDISNGGQVHSFLGALAVSNAAATGDVHVDGIGSTWTNDGATIVGVNGTGRLDITNGGQVFTAATVAGANATLGSAANSQGTAVVDGFGSAWNVNAELWIGQAGNGDLTVSNGGSVTAANGIQIAVNAGSTGDLTIGAGGGSVIAPTVTFGAGTGTLNFNQTNAAGTYTFSSAISGLGTINHNSGQTHLTGNSAGFTGNTHVTGGEFSVDGTLGSGTVDVASGAAIGGGGTILGNVNVASGGTIFGAQGVTLTMGNLVLADGSTVRAAFSDVGGAALFHVVNDLTLDGTLNLSASGAFGPGVYALMTYGGALTDNGLDIGVVPTGSTAADYVVQTSVAGEVNVINNAIPTFSFWDGDAAGAANNNAIDGGSGVWSATSTNFTNVAGSTNGSMYPQPGFAIFQAPGGSVVVDNGAGQVAVTGMQFAADGYSVSGGSIELADADSIIRVGNGSAAGAGFITGIDSVLTGAGGLNKTDFGTLVLTGANTYTGGTTVSGGTLQIGEGGTYGAIVGDVSVATTGTLAFNRSDVVTFAGRIQGSGFLEHNGFGTTNLTNAGNSIGNVFLNDGTLGVTSGGSLTTGTIFASYNPGKTALNVDGAGSKLAAQSVLIGGAGSSTMSVTNGGTVTSNLAAIGIMAGSDSSVTVNGAGSVWANGSNLFIGAAGSGTLTIANGGAVSVGGQLVVADSAGSAGTLNIGAAVGSPAAASGVLNAATLQFGAGAGTLNFNHVNTNYVFGTALSGAGTINQLAGNTNLTGASNGFAGAVNVNGGRLAVNGSLSGGLVTVNNGGTLGGNGVIGSLTANAGSIVAPGNSIGTLNVAGNASFANGSIYQVELNAAGQSDLLNVAGSVNIANGAKLSIIKTDATPYVLGTHYTVLKAGGTLTGAFSFDPIQLTNFIGVVVGSDAHNIYLDVAKTKTFASAGATANETAVGKTLDGMPINGVLVGAVANLMDDASAQGAFNQLSGEIHASTRGVLIEDSRFVREAAMDRLRGDFGGASAQAEGFAAWGRALGSWGRMDGDGNAASVDRDNAGFLMGVDGVLGDTWRVGVLGGYSQSDFDNGARNGSGSSDNYSVGAYAGAQYGKIAIRAGLAYTWHDLSTQRSVSFANFSDALSSDYKAGTTQAFGELGYSMTSGKVTFEPFANIAYVGLSTDGFAEKGGLAALTGTGDDTNVTFTTLGSRAATTFTLDNGWNVTARGTLGWRHAFGDTTPEATMAFAGSSAFAIGGAPIAQDAAVLDLGLDMNVSEKATLGLSYGGQFGSGSDHTVRASFTVKF